MMLIRKAEIGDLKALLDIYNYEVENGVATFDLQPKTLEEREKWFYNHNIENHPLYVAEVDGMVAGYAGLSAYREKEAYQSTVELSIYIAPAYRRKGIATSLMAYILDAAKADSSIHTVVSVITSGNKASVKLHEKFGFTFCGTIKEVGMKFGQYLSIDNYSLCIHKSPFSLKERCAFYKKKWLQEHLAVMILCAVVFLLVTGIGIASGRIYLMAAGMLVGVAAYLFLYNRMMAYVEQHAYDGSGY